MDRLDAIGESELREVLLYVRGSAEPVSADDAAAVLGVHRSVARSRLERLVSAGVLGTSFARRSGRTGPGAGRPAKLYSPSPETQPLEFPPRHLPTLVARLLDAVPVESRETTLREVGEKFGHDLAGAAGLRPSPLVKEGLEGVCAAVRSLGFHAVLDRINGDTAVITTPTCPLRPLVAERPEASLIDRGMWAGLIEKGIRGAPAGSVECETHSCLNDDETCAVIVHLRRPATRAARPSSA
jgi:predicted ArsR family transcriptional regulator